MRIKFTLISCRPGSPFARLLIAVLCCDLLAVATQAQTNFQRLKSFGFPDMVGLPSAIIEGSDGAFYGTTSGDRLDGAGTVYKLNKDGTSSILHQFRRAGGKGCYPNARLVEGNDGALYGTTAFGGEANVDYPNGAGTVFRLNKNGDDYAVLHDFGQTSADGNGWYAELIGEGTNGMLYGTTPQGGSGDVGTVFKINEDGSGYTLLHSFILGNEGSPQGLIQGSDGALYGTTDFGGPNHLGTVFRLNQDGSRYVVLHNFGAEDGNGFGFRVIEGSDRALYGTRSNSGTNYAGTVFKLNKDGNGYTVIYRFISATGRSSSSISRLVQNDQSLYGTIVYDGYPRTNDVAAVFKLNMDGSGYEVIHSFMSDSVADLNNLISGRDDALYATSYDSSTDAAVMFKLNHDGSGYHIVRRFGSGTDGAGPQGVLVEGSNGEFYGTTLSGGTNAAGTVFKLRPDGSGYSVLHHFSDEDAHPKAGLLKGSDGALYGTSLGTYDNASGSRGTVFKLNQDGSGYLVLHHFSGGDGRYPQAALVQASDDALYGTTWAGGAYTNFDRDGLGTIFKLNKDGSCYRILHAFGSSDTDGNHPTAGLMEASDGTLYGTTYEGGASNNFGTVFKLNKDGSGYSVFQLTDNANHPHAGLIEGRDGILYGTTDGGGAGTVFKINKDGSGYTRVLFLDGEAAPHGNHVAGLVEGIDGALYGTTPYGGINNVFKLNKDGSGYMNLHSFSGEDGHEPLAGLVQGSDGALYGTTSQGGDLGFGTVFKLFSPTPVISFERIEPSGAATRLSLSGGASGQTFQIQATTNLVTLLWQAIGTNQFGVDGKFQFLDTSASNYATRFYRSATP